MDTLYIIEKYNITKVHAFPFSAHNKSDSIPASKFEDQIPEKLKKERMKAITDI
jgi:tRNA A37 methylthiotransferase MiaB